MQQLEDGVHDIPNHAYHASLGLSRSALMEFKRSPYHYWHKYMNPNAERQKTTPAMRLGEYVHALVLEPEYFEERYIIEPNLKTLPKVGLLKDLGREEYDFQKADREATQADNEAILNEFEKRCTGREILSQSVYMEAKHYADSVLRDDVAQALFTNVQIEKSIYFTHKPTGLQCKVRPDAWAGGIVTDLKTCADASFQAFQRSAMTGGYFVQAGMIKYALESLGLSLQKFIFYCVEKSDSAPCVWYELDCDSLERGENEFNNLMYGVANCMENNNWHSYEPQTLTYPRWARYED